MGADKWSVCPRCKKKAEDDRESLRQQIDYDYGVIPQDKYLDMVKEYNTPIDLGQTLAEYYEFIMDDDGSFEVYYEGLCKKCNFVFNFDHKEQVEV